MTIGFGNAINAVPVAGGGGEGGTTNYNDLTNKPKINGVVLAGDKTSEDLGITGGASTATDVSVVNTDFQILTGVNVQEVLKQADTKLALNENYDSILLSLDPLNHLIGGSTDVPLGSLQTQLIDGRPSHKSAGALIYDEFGTIGILDHIEAQTAFVTTLTGRGSSSNPIETYAIQKNGLDQYYIPVGSEAIRADIAKNKLVRLSFNDTITNTGEQIYDFQTFDKENYAIFRRNVVTSDKVERINIKVNYQGIVTFETVTYSENKANVIDWVTPSDKTVNMTLVASNETITMPATGYLRARATKSNYIVFTNNDVVYANNGNVTTIHLTGFYGKGAVVNIAYAGTLTDLVFTYAKGAI